MADTSVLVYHHHHAEAPIPSIPSGLAVIAGRDLGNILAKNPSLQRTSVNIPRGATHIEIQERDLLTDSQKTQWAGMPNYGQNVAGVQVPFRVLLGNVTGVQRFQELVVLSRKR